MGGDLVHEMIGKMCSERRPPKMTIPVQHYDEDFFIDTTLRDVVALLEKDQEQATMGYSAKES